MLCSMLKFVRGSVVVVSDGLIVYFTHTPTVQYNR
jgi:hypothetical protein